MPEDYRTFSKSIEYLGLEYSEADTHLLLQVVKRCHAKAGKEGAKVGLVIGGMAAFTPLSLPAVAIGPLIGLLAGNVSCINREFPWKDWIDGALKRAKEPWDHVESLTKDLDSF